MVFLFFIYCRGSIDVLLASFVSSEIRRISTRLHHLQTPVFPYQAYPSKQITLERNQIETTIKILRQTQTQTEISEDKTNQEQRVTA